ncbi:glycosyltransferase [Idiomarina abyssalis]|uniref:glycosyltransferase n=1 Tax=Idiomarina abyssalis TaxID=86102 RepID=UPI003A94604D
MKSSRILIVVKGLGLGGAERHVVDIAIALAQAGHSVSVCYVLPNKNALASELKDARVTVECIGGRVWWISAFPKFLRAVFRQKPDIIHAHLPIPAIIARLCKPFFRYSLVFTEHNMLDRLHPITRIAHRATHVLDDVSISCSRAVADSLPWPSEVIDNGIAVPAASPKPLKNSHLRSKLGISEESVVFISVANLWAKKNHRLLIDAFDEAFRDEGESAVNLVLVGQDGTERERLERHVDRLTTNRNIHFFGGHPSASSLLPEADVFCLSSDFEGLPIALLESMAAGIPSVTTRVGGIPSAVIDDKTGCLVDPRDQDKYALALRYLFENPNVRREMGEAAFNLVRKNFSLESMMIKTIKAYEKALVN